MSLFTITIDTDIDKPIKALDKLRSNILTEVQQAGKQILVPYILNAINELIVSGGSTIPKWSWGYYERQNNRYVYKTGKLFSFSSGYGQKIPIHPLSYGIRKVRKKPKSGQFALYDTKDFLNSFKIINSYVGRNVGRISIGNITKKLDYHENFKNKRVVLEPVHYQFENSYIIGTFEYAVKHIVEGLLK